MTDASRSDDQSTGTITVFGHTSLSEWNKANPSPVPERPPMTQKEIAAMESYPPAVAVSDAMRRYRLEHDWS